MNEDLSNLTDKELQDAYKKGCAWTASKEQKTGSDLAEDGKPYNHQLYMKGLHRIEALEDEMRRRKIKYE